MHPVGAGFQRPRIIGDRGGDGIAGNGPTVIGFQQAQGVAVATMGPGKAQRQIHGFRA